MVLGRTTNEHFLPFSADISLLSFSIMYTHCCVSFQCIPSLFCVSFLYFHFSIMYTHCCVFFSVYSLTFCMGFLYFHFSIMNTVLLFNVFIFVISTINIPHMINGAVFSIATGTCFVVTVNLITNIINPKSAEFLKIY